MMSVTYAEGYIKPFMVSVVMLSVIMLNVIMLSVMAPPKEPVFFNAHRLAACPIKLFTLVIDPHCCKLVSLLLQSFSTLV
jgi:hypothetical protein